MTDSFGLGDGPRDLSTTPAIAETQMADAQRRQAHAISAGRWPSSVTVIRVLLAVACAIVLAGWALTALNGGA